MFPTQAPYSFKRKSPDDLRKSLEYFQESGRNLKSLETVATRSRIVLNESGRMLKLKKSLK